MSISPNIRNKLWLSPLVRCIIITSSRDVNNLLAKFEQLGPTTGLRFVLSIQR